MAIQTAQSVTARAFEIANGADPISSISLLRQGPSDPQMIIREDVVLRAVHTAAGPATVELRLTRSIATASGWGPGAAAALELVPGMIGTLDDPSPLRPQHAAIAELVRTNPGLRLTRSGSVMDALLVAILGQKVTGKEARASFVRLLMRHGEPAPGPFGLRLPPPPHKLARLPYWAFHPLGVERRRADTIRAAAAVALQLEQIAHLSHDAGKRRLMSLPGVGEWTAAETMRMALGDPDAVSVGDYHLPHLVCATLAGEPRGTDERMLELLEPYRGQRARVALLIEHAGVRRDRHTPRIRLRSIAAY